MNQATVPEAWASPIIKRFIRITYLRQLAIDASAPRQWLGGSERGLWFSEDGGQRWQAVAFDGDAGTPQVAVILEAADGSLDRAFIASDDGIWQRSARDRVRRFALDGRDVHSLTWDEGRGVLVAASDHRSLHEIDPSTGVARDIDIRASAAVPASDTPLGRYLLNIHFGEGLLPQPAGRLLNDFGGAAMLVLSTTGCLYWFFARRFRRGRSRMSAAGKQRTLRWLFRAHGPVVGLLALAPIFYLSVTGIFGNHAIALYERAARIEVPAALVPPGFSMQSLEGEIQDIVSAPGAADRWLMSTRKGLFESTDRGASWTHSRQQPLDRDDFGHDLHLFRVADRLFVGAGVDANRVSADGGRSWQPVVGPLTGISSGSTLDGNIVLKNSQGAFAQRDGASFEKIEIGDPPLEGTPLYLFVADVHTGRIIAPWFPWVSDLLTILALVLVATGPILWLRKKWI